MRKNITDEFTGAAEKNLIVFYNDDTGEFEVWYIKNIQKTSTIIQKRIQ